MMEVDLSYLTVIRISRSKITAIEHIVVLTNLKNVWAVLVCISLADKVKDVYSLVLCVTGTPRPAGLVLPVLGPVS